MVYYKSRDFIQDGFTLLEVLLSITLIAILAAISVPFYQSFQVRNDLDIATNTVVQALRQAQTLSQAVDQDISWGVKIQIGSIILFKGPNYISRDSSYDEIYDISSGIASSGLDEIVFAKFTGEPPMTGTTILTSSGGEIRNITINSKGMITY